MTGSAKGAARRNPPKPARFGARLTPDQKALLERAAALTGRSLTDFVVSSAERAAVRTIREYEIMTLSREDAEVMMRALLNPPAPGPRLREAVRRYKAATAE